MTTTFYAILMSIIRAHVPFKRRPGRYPLWFSCSLIFLLAEKDKAHRLYKRTGDTSAYEKFCNLRRLVKAKITACHKKYLIAIQAGLQSHIKEFWAYTKTLKKTNSYPKTMHYDGRTLSTNEDIAEAFKDFFQSVHQQPKQKQRKHRDKANSTLSSFAITIEKVLKVINGLDADKGAGSDGIPNVFIKSLAEALVKPLCIIFNTSLSSGSFPTQFKDSIIHPIYKNDDKQNIRNLRPVSILNAFGKIFERIVHEATLSHVSPYLNSHQHGFLPRRSTVSNLLEYSAWLANNLEQKKQIDMIYLDFSKAFDTVSHSLLMDKLHDFGITGKLHQWFASYISQRSVKVGFNGVFSSSYYPCSGVPQGSILGPLLFVIYVDELPELIKSYKLLYADDCKLGRVIDGLNDCHGLQADLDILSNWSTEHDLRLNATKCSCLTITNKTQYNLPFSYKVDDVSLPTSNNIKDLGVTFDTTLHFKQHVVNAVNKAYRALGFVIRTSRLFTDPVAILELYQSLVIPHLEYACSIWNPYYDNEIKSIERVQRRFTRYMFRKFNCPRAEYHSRANQLKLMTLRRRRVVHDQMTLYNILHSNLMVDSASVGISVRASRPTRNTDLFHQRTWRLETCHNAPVPRMIRFHNR